MDQGCEAKKNDSKMEKIFREIGSVKEISLRVRAKSQDIYSALLGDVQKDDSETCDKTPALGTLELIIDQIQFIQGVLINADGLLTSVSNAVCK